jgi:hypothetical protein
MDVCFNVARYAPGAELHPERRLHCASYSLTTLKCGPGRGFSTHDPIFSIRASVALEGEDLIPHP